MKFAYQTRTGGDSMLTGEVLSEAMPWIKNVTGKTIVVKYGGSAMASENLRRAVMADIVLLKIIGVRPVIVHGGGKAINREMEREHIPVEFVDGQRVTSDEGMRVVRNILTGEVNQELVWEMNQHGNIAVGLSGTDAGCIVAEQADPKLGKIGKITRINAGIIEKLVEDDYIPIIASIALGEGKDIYNINADVAAGHIAAAIGAHKAIFISDVDGIYANYPDQASLIASMTTEEAREMLNDPNIATGMIPKLESCIHALDEGVSSVHVINGTRAHALLLELLTNQGTGTCISHVGDTLELHQSPVDPFASRLLENRIL